MGIDGTKGAARESLVWQKAAAIADDASIPWDELRSRRVLVTGSTGLIGQQFVRALMAANSKRGLSVTIVLPVRNIQKAQDMFAESYAAVSGDAGSGASVSGDEASGGVDPSRSCIELFQWELGEPLSDTKFDFAIHAASSTSSSDFRNRPVEVICNTVDGCRAVLEQARKCDASKVVFLSTMEVYGEVEGDATEDNLGKLDPMNVRNSYPEAKRLCECLCASYASEYGLPAAVARLAQSFGEGVPRTDGRVFAEFGRCAAAGEDIKLVSDGTKRNSYVSVGDAVRALLFILLEGESGAVYNVANEATYCSVREMAEMVLEDFSSNESAEVTHISDPAREATFRKSSDLILRTGRLEGLGWNPKDSLSDMYQTMLEYWAQQAL